MSESTLKPFTGKLDENIDTNQQPALKPFTGALDGEKKGVIGHLKDTGLSALKGAVAVPELAVGIMDVMSDGATGKILENKNGTVGFRPKEAKQALGDLHTDQYKAQQQEFADAGKDGNWVDKVVDKTKVALTNPSLIANTVVESVPSMLAGGALGRASGIANPVVAGAVGEGAVMAGSQAEQIRQQTVDGRLTADQSLSGVGTGALGGLIGFAGGRLAQKMGIGDVDTMLVTGRAGPADIAGEIASMPAKSLPRRVIEGAISEGFLEELPQSVSEQVIQNLALDKPWHDGIEDAAVMGTLAGMAMGGAANILSGHNTGTESQDNQQQSGSPNLPSAPSQSGSSSDSALTGEYIPRENVPQGDNQGRTAFVYDQPSMDADNLLNNNYKSDADFDTSGNLDPSNNPDSPLSPSGGNYFDDHSTQPQLPSERLGINPNDGPMSSAAALAVDSGASPVTPQLGYTPDQSNTQADNAGESISQQYDLNAVGAMGGEIETDTAQTVQPILGQDGKNKWFGTQDKAQAFIDKKKLGNDYQVVQDGKRFEIQPKSQDNQTQNVDTLPKTESSNQDDVPNPYNENKLRAQVRDLNLQASKEAQASNAEDSKYIANLGNTASARSNEKVKQQLPDLYKRAEELAKTAEITSAGRRGNTYFSSLSFKGDSSFVSGDAWPKRPTKDEVLQQAIWHLSQDDKNGTPKNVQSALQLTELEKQFKNEKSVAKKAQIRKQITELQNGLTEQAQSTVGLNQPQKTTPTHPVNQWKSDMEEALAKADPEHPQFKKLQLNAKHGLKSEGDRETALRQAREIEKKTSKTIEENTTTQSESKNPNGKAPSPTEQKVLEALQRNDTQQNGKKLEQATTILANRIKQDGAEYFTLGWNKDAQLTAEARDYIEEILDEALSNLGIKGFDDADSFSKLTNDVLESIDDVYATANDSSWDNRPVKDKDGNYNAPKLVKVKDENGRTRYVLEHELNNPNVEYLQNFKENGRRSIVRISRDNIFQDTPQNEQDASPVVEKKADASKVEPEKPKAKAEPSKNTLVSDDRAAELRARLKAKLSQLNSGIDPEIMAIGAELAVYHIERGARKFAALAKNIANDLDVSVEKIRPYLRSWYNGARDMMEDMGADIQGMDSAETVRAELAKLDNPQQQSTTDGTLTNEGTMTGKTETVVTPAGREFEVRHKVVEADDLITSNLDSGAINSEYPQALQPRDRTTLKSVTQVNDIANKLNPKLLGDSASSTNGAPIVSPGNEVESGNGRTLAIRKAYQTGKADAYKDWLSEQGYDVANMQQPVLVRERITPMNMAERVAYTTESNERETLDMSPSEQAMSDAPKVMDILHLVQGGSFNNTANRDFVNAFLTGVASKNERGTMLDKDGVSLTQDGYRRIESALLAAAFNDAQIISQVIESKDSDIKAIGNALIEAAPQWAQVRKGVQEGILVEGVNVEANLVEAVHLVRKARQQNLSLSEMLNQDDIFDGSIDQVTKDFVSIFYRGDKLEKARSSQKVAEALKSYAQLAMTAKATPNLFGDAPLSNEQILGQVHDRLKQGEAEKQQDIFSSQGNDDTGNGKPSETGQGPASSQSNAATSKSNTAVTRPTVERPKNDTTLVQDWGVQYVDGWATNSEHTGKIYTDNGVKDGVKAAFLKDSKKYLEAVQKNLEGIGYELHLNKKGKPEKVSVNESGVAGSGEVSLYIREPVTGVNVWMKIGDGFPGSHPQRIGILYRATMKESDKQASGFGIENSGNQYAGANTSAFELAQMIDDMVTALVKRNQNKENSNEQPASNTSNPQGTSTVRGGRGRTSQSNAPQANNPNVETGVSTGSGTSNQNQSTGRSRIRDTGTDVENDGRVSGRGMESSRRKDASGTGQLSVDQPTRLESPAAVANTATDFYMADPDIIFGGSQKQRFDKNKKALELLEELNAEGRQATAEEQVVLASYTGWGSFGQDLFQGTWNTPVFKDGWKDENLWLREKLGKESWESAKDSVLNAFFTDPYTVQAMWSMAEKMGFTGGRVLEPAVGTGNFISLMPMHIKQRSQVTAIDLDITTAAIAKQLFPESNVQNMPYQKSKTPDNFYDLVISNVPFSNDVKIADRRYNQFNPNLHDYYFLKMLDQVRPGGIVMAITSSGTMDKQSEVIRREMAKQSELITSIRLPAGAFKDFAGTNVVTDIIVLRKRTEPLTMTPDADWIGLSEVKTSTKPVKVNSFYANNLRNVLGTIDYKGGDPRFAGMTVLSNGEAWLKKELSQLSDLVSENTLLPRHNDDYLTYYANKAGERTNTLTMSNGELMFVYGDQMVKATDLFEYKIKDAKKTAQRQKSIEDLVAIRKAYTDLTDAERIEQDNVEQLRKSLNKLYQAYVKAHGPLADSFGLQYFKKMEDAYYYSLAALENNGKPAEILKRSVVRGAAALQNPTVADAFVVERNKSAAPSLANIAKMAQVSEDQARAELLEKGAVYVLPNGDIMPSDMYLSGNVRQKLEEAQNAVAEGNADLQRNVDALKEIIPEDIPYFNIEAKMGATWVPLSDYEKYIAHMLGMTDSNGITVTFPSGKWKVKLDPIAARRTEATTNYGSKYKSFQTVVSAALSNQNITVKYKNADGSESVDVQATEEVNEKISKIKEDFATWLWSDPERRVQLEKEYNHAFNAWATPKYDGSFMSMQGMALSLGNGPFNLRQHQQNAIWRAIVNRRSINAHEVGTGKTFTMGGIALESRRYGIAKKPLILAHNANSAAVAKEIQMMYPSARVLFISELGKAVRQIRMRQIANDDWDVVVMPHSMIDKLTLSEETLMAMAADDIAALEAELEEALAEEGGATLDEVLAMDSETVNKKMGFKNPTAKQLAKQRLKLLEDIQKQAMDSSKADAVNFEELGVDMIMVDEVHEFKKPSIATRMNMKGLNTSSNKRSVNLQLLTRYVRRMNNGGNVHTFTGTPITNTLTEIYHQMRYVMEEEMQKLNVAAWDGWFGSFATDITDIELSATGEYQLVTRLAGFVNVPELRKMIGQFMDIVFANDMPEMQPRKTKTGKVLSDEGLTEAEKAELLNGRTEGAKDRPYKKVINVTTEMSPKQEQTLAEIQSLAKEWERASGKEKRKWMRDGDPRAPLSISTAAKKASYDARIGDPEYVGKEGQTEDFEMSKASQVVKNVMEVYHSHPLASQVIFADTGYNTTTERSTGQKDDKGKTIRERVKVFSPIKDIVERLVQSGIPREQIAIVDGSVKAEARKAIADKVNTGEIRVVIGLTQTLGVGVNMQRNLRAMHHLDAPWMPGELEQRNGRGLRQGNQWNTVLEYRYITDKLDGKSWQVLAIKDRFINAFMKADGNVRSIEGDAAADNGEDNAGDIMSSFSEASGDPRVLQRIKMKEKLEKLQRKERLHTQGIADMKRTIGNTQRRIARFDEQIAEYENNAVLDRIQKLMQSQSENFSAEVDGKKYDKHKEASDAIQQFIADHVRTGSSRITLGKYGNVTMSVEWDSLQPQATLSMKIGPIEFKGNTLRGIEGKLRGVSQDIQAIEDAKASSQQTIDSLSKAVEQPFGQSDQLARTQKQLENIEQDLESNPVAPPIWLRRGTPIDSEVYYKGKLFIVSGHRYTNDGWFVSADDAKGTIEIPYLEATDSVGMPIYEEREFEAPNINDKTKADNDVKNEINDYSRDKLKPDNERRGTSPLDTTFNALSVVSATRRVLSVLQHLKLSATQDSSISGRITVGSAGIKGGFDVQVISSFDGLPTEIQKDATYQDDKGNTQNYDVSAVWHKGTLYVVADQVYGDNEKQITTFDAYEEMLAHEIIGHFGVQQIFGQEYKTKLQQLYNALGELEGIRKIASKNGVNMAQFESAYIEPYTQGAKEGIYAESDVQQALVGELFAFVAQNAKSRPFVRQKLKEVIGYIRQWFRDRGFDKFLSRYNDADLMMFLSEARKAVVDRSYFGKYKNQEFSSKNNSDTPLYSRRTKSNSGSTVQQVRGVLIDRFGKETIDELERQGKLEIIQDYQVEGVEGFYYNGKAVLVASNLTAESTVPTFLHELGGHAGFQNMMNQKQYNELMNQFNKLVEQGNPVALAAKMLAEREQGSERQQLEYLPYLLTLSSTMQQRNVIQRNALQKLINNIISYVKAWVFDNFGINLNLNPDDMLVLSERMIGQIKHQSSLDLIRQKYHGTNKWMTAPNGAKTHLSEQQWLQVRTPEFKKWFGDWENDAANASQVLDENGEPKVVYHGTATEFNEFKQGHGLLGDGIYLTDSFDTADVYANIRGENGFVLPLFVNIRNAFKTTGNVSRDEFVEATTSGKYQGIVHQFENQEYIVALEPNQVKMAEGNKGTFNSESSDIRFSRSAKDIIDNLSKNLGNISISSVKDKTGYKFTDWLGIGLSALGRRQLTEIYSKILPQLNKYNELAAQMDADKNDAGAEADSIVREWANLNDEDQLAELMHDSTLAKIDPTKPYVKGDSVSRYKQLRDDYNSLSPEAQAMYLKARDAYKKHYAKVHQAIKERILRSELSSQKKADLLKQMDDNFFGYVKGVYFPLARFGKYVVVMRNQNGEVESVSRAETMGEAQSLRSELMQKYPHYKTDRVVLDKEFNASRDAVGRGFMTNLFAEVDNLGLSTAEQAEFEDTLSQLYLSSMPDLSWAKHGIHRKGTAGFSQDARRAFAQNMFHGAGYLAKLRYGDQLAQQLDDMQKYASEQSKLNDSYDQPTAQRVIDEMNKRHDNLMNPKGHPLSSALTSLGFIYYLGLSPAAAMVNLSQTALVAYPIMGAKWGFDKAANELLKASNDFRKGVEFHKVKWEGSKTDLYKTISSDISKFLSKDEKQAYEDAVARGVIDVTQAHDLAGIAQGEDSGIMWKTRPIMRAASVMFHSAERFNREVTFIAAYRLARQSGEKHDSAFDQAVDATYRGHFDYSSGNRPRIMQGNVAKVLLLFKQFGQNMVYTLARQTYQSIKGETEAERKEARKSLAAILAMHATFAGTLGLPMVGMLLSVASWMGGDDDDPWDAEVALRNYLAEAFGPTISTLLMKGAPRAFTPFDMSGRVGINNMLLPDVQEGLEGKRWAESAMAGALGPVAGIGTNLVKGGQDITEGQTLRGIETMLPVFLKNFAKTYRYADEGVQDKTGVSIMDEVSSMDLLVQGMGFSPSDVRTANEGKTAIYQLNRKLNERRSRLMTLWSRAKMMDDQQEMDEIWGEIQGFNDKNPSRRITRMNLNQSYRNRQRRIDRAEDGIYLSRNRQDAREAGYFAFGE
ncbi:PLxRFG domain-containing protein [Acinetobacter bereziniae]|uniref:PLxRFG domain-containing protein n=1 Tax=Acinetobacter bereziniae TaxID=106648 RepID=A0A9E7TGE3_ACIBZ|nr:PLxRFG domain-containing protein [Acinetobacter bereziniae]UUN99221.1 PLxRFG domain-containing protein [Acinetobacter bereziniae]